MKKYLREQLGFNEEDMEKLMKGEVVEREDEYEYESYELTKKGITKQTLKKSNGGGEMWTEKEIIKEW